MPVRVNIIAMNGGLSVYQRVQMENIKNKVRAKGDAILGRATMIAPKLTGALRSDGRVETIDTSLTVISSAVVFGDDRVPYARRRHFENRKNPQTLNYLEKAGDSVSKESW